MDLGTGSLEVLEMTGSSALTIDRDLEDVKAQVRRELDTIRGLVDTLGYRKPDPAWNTPFQIHRLRRSLRIHYLAYKIRDSEPLPAGLKDLEWDLPEPVDL
ncbi:MAG: hypothetical protein EAX81_05440 [Candidatus Thorarchaeota archaeon]|nr:hypothetical protein [Candidatus Thorarchaeota archaeon]